MEKKITFIALISGKRYTGFLIPFVYSVLSNHSDINFIVYYNDIEESYVQLLVKAFPEVDFVNLEITKTKDVRERISGKFNYILHACQNNPSGSRIAFVDVDALIVKPINNWFADDFDFLFTWKDEQFPLNTGVMLFNNNDAAKATLEYMNNRIAEVLSDPEKRKTAYDTFGAADQYVLNEILGTKDYRQNIVREINGTKVTFKPVPCSMLNETNCVPISDNTHIIHYKAGWHRILLDGLGFHENRPKEKCWEMYKYWLKINSDAQLYMTKHFIINASKSIINDFEKHLDEYEERGILNSELLAFCAACEHLGIDFIVESGRCRGQSTYAIANYFQNKNVDFVSIELLKDENAAFAEERLKDFKRLNLLYGDSIGLLKKNKLAGFKDAKGVAVLLDGPKGEVAVNLAKELFAQYDNISLIAIHDTRKETKQRDLLENCFERVFFTDDVDFVNSFKKIDANCEAKSKITFDSWRPYHKGFDPIKSYGPTLTLILRPYKMFPDNNQEKNSYIRRIVLKSKKIFRLLKDKEE